MSIRCPATRPLSNSKITRRGMGSWFCSRARPIISFRAAWPTRPSLRAKEGQPQILINEADALERGIRDKQLVRVENERGWCNLAARISDEVQPGVAVAPKGQWAQFTPGGRGVNWLTSDVLADLGGQATFHSTLVRVVPLERRQPPIPTPLPNERDEHTPSPAHV